MHQINDAGQLVLAWMQRTQATSKCGYRCVKSPDDPNTCLVTVIGETKKNTKMKDKAKSPEKTQAKKIKGATI
jgi:hypothetical protein